MKSHVKQRLAQNVISDGYRRIETEKGTKIELSSLFKELINAQAPEIIFTDWLILPNKEWSVNAEHQDSHRKLAIVGSSVMDCINKAKDCFANEL